MLIRAGFMDVTQPRIQNEEGAYFGCRAIRVIKTALFEWLNLGPMLARERRRASDRLQRKAQKASRKLSDFMRRLTNKFKVNKFRSPSHKDRQEQQERRHAWNLTWANCIEQGLELHEAQRRTNEALGYPVGYSPGQELRRF